MKRYFDKLAPVSLIIALVSAWQIVSISGLVPRFMLPSPADILSAIVEDFANLMKHSYVTLSEAFCGMIIAVCLSFIISFLMDRYDVINKSIYPLLIITQTVPTIALAPILLLWFGYGVAPKIILITISCFFPVTIGLLDGYKSSDEDSIRLLHTMGASNLQIYKYIKLPSALGHMFASLKVAVSYSIISAVVAEWLGGESGLGVYMIRMKKSYAFDKMFAVIVVISLLSILLMRILERFEKMLTPWNKQKIGG